MTNTFQFWTDCAGLEREDLDNHRAMIDNAREVSYRTFRRAVEGLDEWAEGVGYEPPHTKRGLPLSRDWHVAYYRSVWEGQPCYYLVWSAFECIWRAA